MYWFEFLLLITWLSRFGLLSQQGTAKRIKFRYTLQLAIACGEAEHHSLLNSRTCTKKKSSTTSAIFMFVRENVVHSLQFPALGAPVGFAAETKEDVSCPEHSKKIFLPRKYVYYPEKIGEPESILLSVVIFRRTCRPPKGTM